MCFFRFIWNYILSLVSVIPSFAYLCNYVVVCPTQVGWAINDLRKVREEAELNKLKVLVSIIL